MHRAIVTTLLRQGRRDLALSYLNQYVTAKRGLFYHGTSSVFAKRILSEGFVPDPKRKVFDPSTGSAESYTGTYFTTRKSTANRYADRAVDKYGGFPVIFEVQLETKTGVFDEDQLYPVEMAVNRAIWEYQTKNIGTLTKYTANWLLDREQKRDYEAILQTALVNWMGKGDEDLRNQPFGQLWRTNYGDAVPDDRYLDAVFAAFRKAAKAYIEDVAETGKTDGTGARFRKAHTKMMRVLNVSKYGPKEMSWTNNIRIPTAVTFRGANKIVAAIAREIDIDHDTRIKTNTYWVLYGRPSKALVTDDDARWNKVNDVVKRGWPKPKQKLAASYMMGHRPSKTVPLYDLTFDGTMPDDIYTHPEYYGDMSGATYRQSWNVIQKMRGKPTSKVTVYRAGPVAELNTGDWISLSRAYADLESQTEGVPVHSFKVKVRDVWWPGDDFNEFGYHGPAIKQDAAKLRDALEVEKRYMLKHGKIPPNAVLFQQYSKSKYHDRYGTSPKQQSSAYYEYISDVLSGQVKAATFDDRMDELIREQAKQRRKKIGIDGDRRVTDQIEVSQAAPGKVWSFLFTSNGMEIIRVNGLKRARAMRALLRDSGLRDFRKLRELAYDWRKQNPR